MPESGNSVPGSKGYGVSSPNIFLIFTGTMTDRFVVNTFWQVRLFLDF
jgi:hypothetical protein